MVGAADEHGRNDPFRHLVRLTIKQITVQARPGVHPEMPLAILHRLMDAFGGMGTTRFFERLLVWLFPADPKDVLSAEEMHLIALKAERCDRISGRINFIGSLVCFGLIGLFLRWTDQLSRVPVEEPAWDKMDGLALFFPALFLGLASGIMLSGGYLRLYWGQEGVLYERYQATTGHWNRRRASRWLTGVLLTAGAFLAVMLWHAGEAVGNDAIVYKDGFWAVHRYSYEDVASLGRYNKFRAPVGIVDYANLEIRFKDGEVLRLRSGKGQQHAAVLDDLAEYIRVRASVPLIRGELSDDG